MSFRRDRRRNPDRTWHSNEDLLPSPGPLTKSLGCPVPTGVDCGSKRSATPLWLAVIWRRWIAWSPTSRPKPARDFLLFGFSQLWNLTEGIRVGEGEGLRPIMTRVSGGFRASGKRSPFIGVALGIIRVSPFMGGLSLSATGVPQGGLESSQRFGTNVVLDALGVHLRHAFGNAN